MIIACIQSKGGVAKTTSCVNLSHALAMSKQKVLLIDLDSQGSASLSLGVNRSEINPSIADVLIDDHPLESTIRKTSIPNLSLITGSMSLANFDINLANHPKRMEVIKSAIDLAKKYWKVNPEAKRDEVFEDYLCKCPSGKSLSRPSWDRIVRDRKLDPRTPDKKVRGKAQKQ